jgi:hypothetical protein
MEKQPLPNSNSILILGILSIIVCFYGIGLILGIIAIIQYNKANKLYLESPEKYFLGRAKTGKILAIIGIALSILEILVYLFVWALGTVVSEVLPKGDFM